MNITNDFFLDSESDELLSKFEMMYQFRKKLYLDVKDIEYIVEHYLTIGDFEKAEYAIEMGMEMHPWSNELEIKKVELLIDKNKPLLATNILKKLIKLEPSSPDLQLLMGTSYCLSNNFDLALQYFDHAIELSYEEKDLVNYDCAMALLDSGKFELALPYLEEAYKSNKHDLNIIYDLAFCYDKTGNLDKSIRIYLLYLDENPLSEIAWYNIGVAYSHTGNLEKAIEAFDFAIAIDPEYASPYYNKATVLANSEKFKEAIEAYNEYLQFDESNVDVTFYIGECYENIRQFKKALEYYNKVKKAVPEYSLAWFGAASVMSKKGDFFNALTNIKKAIQLEAQESKFHFLLANIYAQLDLFDKASAAFRSAVELAPFDDKYWIRFADFVFHNKMNEEAYQILKEAYGFNPTNAVINYKLAALSFITNQKETGINYLKNALSIDYSQHNNFFDYYPTEKMDLKMNRLFSKYKKQ